MAKKKKRSRDGVNPATRALVNLRVTEILRLRLDGAKFWDVAEYVREAEQKEGSPWKLKDRQKPFSDGTLWNYIARADALCETDELQTRKKLLRCHLSRRESLYGKAVLAGDLRTALAVLADAAQLRGLYPAAKVKASVKHTGAIAFVEVAASAGLDTDPDADADPSPHRNGCAT